MLNSFLVDISKEGIKGSGGLFGTFSPQIGEVQSQQANNNPSISIRKIQVPQTVSALTNPDFIIPISFGSDKVIIWVNKKLFIIDEDYRVAGTKVTWLNTEISITTSDEVVLWGPSNAFSANLITFERYNLKDSSVYNASELTLKSGLVDPGLFPFSQDASFLFLNGDCLRTVNDYTYDSVTKKYILTNALNPLTDRVFSFYCNLKPSGDYRLGESLVRLKKTDGNLNVSLTSPVNSELKEESHVFHNGGRAVYAKNYAIRYPLLKWDNTQNINYTGGDTLDISYFSDMRFSIDVFSDGYVSTANTNLINLAIEKRLGFHYVNGVLSHPPVSDNELAVAGKDYDISGQVLSWVGSPPINPSYQVVYEGFTDLYAKQYTGIRTGSDTTQSFQLPDIADTSKIIAWKEGIANFIQHGDFTINSLVNPKTLNFVDQDVDDKVVIMYFKQTSYSDLWKFEPVTTSGALPINTVVTLNQSAKKINTCWVFLNGVKQKPITSFVLEDQNRKVKFLRSIPANSKIMFVYI